MKLNSMKLNNTFKDFLLLLSPQNNSYPALEAIENAISIAEKNIHKN